MNLLEQIEDFAIESAVLVYFISRGNAEAQKEANKMIEGVAEFRKKITQDLSLVQIRQSIRRGENRVCKFYDVIN